MINYFNFKRFGDDYLLTNDLGRYMFVSTSELKALLKGTVDPDSDFGKKAIEEMFWYQGSSQAFSEHTIPYMRESKNYLFSATSLHIFVVTNKCNMKCVYCQAQNGKTIPNGIMTRETAQKAVDIALSSPADNLSFEFQGGEPLLNFDVIRFIVEYSEKHKGNKHIQYNIVSNLTLINDEIIKFIKENNIGISTSLDGSEGVHNHNRRYRNQQGTYSDVIKSIMKVREYGICIGAIQTTTQHSLAYAKEIVDTYNDLKMESVFIRPLTPLGCANKDWKEIGYTPEEFIAFYKKCFEYIIELNKQGHSLKEGHASILLQKILSGSPVNYMELRSPCGAGIGQIAYYYDGNIYTCDEGRMLAEMGDDSFKLGNVFENTYDDLMNCDNCKAACMASTLESLPQCSDCVYSPYCGTCPVVNLALQKNIFMKEPNSYRCRIYQGILDIIFSALKKPEDKEILLKWI